MRRQAAFTTVLLTGIALLFLFGCSQEPQRPLAPGPRGAGQAVPQMLADPEPAPVPLGFWFGGGSSTAWISARTGGDVSLDGCSIHFYPGSLPRDMAITLTREDRDTVRFSVKPAGLVLAKPALITVSGLDRTNHLAIPALQVYLVSDSSNVPLESRRMSDRIEADMDVLGEFALGGMDRAGTGIIFLQYLSGPGYQTAYIEAAAGGRVQYGRFALTFPPGALAEDTYITISNPGNGLLMCELEPHGIRFNVPVTLEMDLRGLRWQPYTDWSIYWLDPEAEQWVDEGGSFQGGSLRVGLLHFSTYAAGRAGW
jgi:hypothetical protein